MKRGCAGFLPTLRKKMGTSSPLRCRRRMGCTGRIIAAVFIQSVRKDLSDTSKTDMMIKMPERGEV